MTTVAVLRAELRLRRDARRIARGLGRKHGLNAYARYGCRCDVCRAAKSEANARYKKGVTP